MYNTRLAFLVGLLCLSCLGYMLLGARGSWDFILSYRGAKLAALILVGVSVSTATLLFQTITRNHILTPAIMGFDALYILLLTAIVFAFGGQAFVQMSEIGIFLISMSLLVFAATALFGTLLGQVRQDIMRMILTGIIFGVLFRSLTSFLQRMVDPNEYSVIQSASIARFTQINTTILSIACAITLIALIVVWRMQHRLDVLALGHDAAINLGETPRTGTLLALILVAILTSVSTALVGPVAFLGLLVVNLARQITPTIQHSTLLISSALIAVITLVGGQTLLERVFALSTPLSVIVDVVGGAVFLLLLLRGIAK